MSDTTTQNGQNGTAPAATVDTTKDGQFIIRARLGGVINVKREGMRYELSGDTFDYKSQIKRTAARWQPWSKSWTIYAAELPPEILALGEVAPYEGGSDPDDDPLDVDPDEGVSMPTASIVAGIVEPSYWSDLNDYLTPGACRPAIALVGPAGNGKTTAAEAICRHMGYDYIVIDANEFLEPADLVGAMSYHPERGEVWRDGPITRAFRAGSAVIINEFDALNPRTAMCLQSVTQDPGAAGKGRYVTTPGADEDRVYPAGDCPLIVTMNTYGTGATRQYVGRNALDAATADRFTIIPTGYENEAYILRAAGRQVRLALRLEKWARITRQKIDDNALRVILSMRTLLRIAQAVEDYRWVMDDAIEKEFYGRLDPDVREVLR